MFLFICFFFFGGGGGGEVRPAFIDPIKLLKERPVRVSAMLCSLKCWDAPPYTITNSPE